MKIPLRQFSLACGLAAGIAGSAFAANTNTAKPNILIIDADDMGFGDVHAFGSIYGTSSVVPTPTLDSLVTQGMTFTNMHACASLCTPSRYGLLTGRYSWRLGPEGVLNGGDSGANGRPIIRQGELTIAQFLKNHGYNTAAFGKWHLGAQWYNKQGVAYTGNGQTITDPAKIDLVRRVEGHAIDQGFQSFYGLTAAINQPPYATMVDDRVYFNGTQATASSGWVTILGSSLAAGSSAPDGVGDPNFSQQAAGPDMVSHAVSYLNGRASQSTPFFAYVALYSPHLPLLPTAGFVGSSGFANFPYGDYICQTDHWISQIINALGANASNTIIIVTSDNGPETTSFVQGLNKAGHDANGPFKGVKRDSWEGGARIPFIVKWPGKVAAGSVSNALVWQGDIFDTVADYLNVTLAAGDAPDSVSFLPVLLGTGSSSRNYVVTASSKNQLSLLGAGGWKLIDGTKGGGNDTSYDASNNTITSAAGTVGGTPKQLYWLPTDRGETSNVQASNPSQVTTMLNQLNTIKNNGN